MYEQMSGKGASASEAYHEVAALFWVVDHRGENLTARVDRERELQRYRERERQSQRESDIQTDTQTDTQTERKKPGRKRRQTPSPTGTPRSAAPQGRFRFCTRK